MKKLLTLTIILSLILTLSPTSFGKEDSQRMLQGNIEGLNFKENTITILDYDGERHSIKILPTTTIEIEGVWKDIYHLYYGQEVDIILEKSKAIKIIGYMEEDPERDGYIIPGSRFRTGDVLFLSQNSIEIKTKDKREKYRITPYTTIIKSGEIASINQVKSGDKVELTFDDIYSTEVSTLRVQDEEKHIAGILKGKIHSVDERKKEVHIKTPYIYKEGTGWLPYGNHIITLKVQGDQLYNEGERTNLKELNKFRNKDVYIAYDTGFGNKNIAKLQVKTGSSRNYEAPVKDIEYGTRKMIVDRTLIHFNPGTIVIKNNRLVDILNIDRNQDVFVNTDIVRGRPIANFVSIGGTSLLDDRIDGTKISIYRGKVEDIYQYKVKIGKINYRLDHLKLTENNRWKQLKKSETFDLTEDTLIYDSQLKEYIPANYFISSRYINLKDIKDTTLRKRVENNFYKNRTAYFVVRESTFGKELLALNLTPHINEYRQNVNMNYSTIGEIKEIDYDDGSITFTKIKNYNTLNKRWENTSDERVDINEAVILLNDLPIPEDKLYLLRQGAQAYIMKNKDSSIDKGYVILIED